MTSPRGPQLIYVTVESYDGWALIVPRHGLTAEEVAELVAGEFPDTEPRSQEVHWRAQRRVVWCGRHGDPCDMEGERHTHWHQVMPTGDPACQWTVLWGEQPFSRRQR